MHHQHCGEWRNLRNFARGGFGRGPFGTDEEGGRGFGPGRHWGGMRGRGFGRPFDHGELRVVVLALIAERPRHGYEIIKAIEERLGGSYSPSPGVIYPTLTMLEELGHATVEETGGKKLYTITDAGREYMAANQAATDAAMGRMQEIGAAFGESRNPQLVRALHNFKMALALRQRTGPLTAEQIRSIVEAIDAAATAIERS
jgi:DNA-binding PadR family transcriptional regulator